MSRFKARIGACILSALLCVSMASAALAADVTIKASIGLPQHDATVTAFQEGFIKYVTEASQGRIKVDLYHTNSLGNADAVLNGMRAGVIQVAVESLANMSQFLPALSVLDLPYIFPTEADVEKFAKSDILKGIFAKLKGVDMEDVWMSTYRALVTKRPVLNLEEAAGMKIRTTKSKLHMLTIRSLGMNPTPMSGAEVITSLQQGVVDGTDSELPSVLYRHYAEVTKYVLRHDAVPCLWVMFSSSTWKQKLAPADLEIIEEGFRRFHDEAQRQYATNTEEVIAELTSKHGVQISSLSAEEKARWIAKAASAFDELSASDKKLVDEIRAFLK